MLRRHFFFRQLYTSARCARDVSKKERLDLEAKVKEAIATYIITYSFSFFIIQPSIIIYIFPRESTGDRRDRCTDSPQYYVTSFNDNYHKTTAHYLEEDMDDKSFTMIASFSPHGFRMGNSGVFLFGPVAVFPKLTLSWQVGK